MPKKDYVGVDLRNRDLRNKDMTDQVMYGADIRGAQLSGVKMSVSCATFGGMKMDDEQVGYLLLMISKADISQDWKDGINQLVEGRVDADVLWAMRRVMAIAER